ncbi:GTPase-activator protein for Ras-like GTPase containing protein [Metarhizium guizhouense ARSEF 977]|uniref:GTPase-activator protein for Ras-like GTPase containing protein n=1 Tax=Metarhizium guizhouense (strain ARSEF 977) TaxID=1276136 RepID=A0A0B4GY47_METGA|nr:GTPase-activator protein for Ras-like GTPase containing protein [Metarhizium guizhouense ARSEF 977]
MASQLNVDELIRAAEHHHEQYLQTLRSIQNAVGQRTRERADSRATVTEAVTPPLRALSHPTFFSPETHTHNAHLLSRLQRTRTSTLETTAERPSFYPSPKPVARSTISHDSEFIPDEELSFIPLLDAPSAGARPAEELAPPPADITSRTQKPLLPLSFSDDMLMQHLRETEFDGPTATVLDEVVRRRPDMDLAVPFRDFAAFERESYVSTTFEVYEVTANAEAKKISVDIDVQADVKYGGEGVPYQSPDGIVDAPTVWEAIKDVNSDGEAVGRITIVQEPTPLILAALHLTMTPHFDMGELLTHLLSEAPNRGRTNAIMHRAFERTSSVSPHPPSPLIPPALDTRHQPASSYANVRQRSFFFVFKYYTSVAEGLEPAPWQRFDKRPSDKRLGDHIDIAECSSVLALSLGGEPTKPLRMRPRRERAREGFLFDTFGPWQLLSIQSFPDDQHTVRGEDFQKKSFYNGPYAFLDLLTAEYRDAGRRNQILHEKITKLITPPTEFMFDRRLRDKLLFEDKHFTYIRRYFWAYNTLAVINTGIKAMVGAYFDTFTDDFWSGNHPVLWPHSSPSSPEGEAYLEKMALLRRELEKVVAELGDVLKRNERTRKEIENLRDQLFSGSSIKESRRAIDQGDNIRILTMISMIFLPLTFVTASEPLYSETRHLQKEKEEKMGN